MSVPVIVESLPPIAVKSRAFAVLTAITTMPEPLTVNQYGQITYKGVFEPFSNINQLITMATTECVRCKLFDVPGLHAFMSALSLAHIPTNLLSSHIVSALKSKQTVLVRPTQEWRTFGDRLVKK